MIFSQAFRTDFAEEAESRQRSRVPAYSVIRNEWCLSLNKPHSSQSDLYRAWSGLPQLSFRIERIRVFSS